MTMYFIWCLITLAIINTEANSTSSEDFFENIEDQSWIFASTENETLDIIDLKNVSSRLGKLISEDDVIFRLYTRKNPYTDYTLQYLNSQNLKDSNFNPNNPTKIIVHGWNSNGFGEINILVRPAYLRAYDANVIFVDWGMGAYESYAVATKNVKNVASAVSRFINWLVKEGANLEDFHCIGHSLGAHVLGIAGRKLNTGIVPYITALDPAFPLWTIFSPRIKVGDAKYVEVIHTNAGISGIPLPIGDNDFYPNGGKHMKGCEIKDFGCSHSTSYRYFAYSIGNRNFKAIQCKNFREILVKKCSNISSLWMGGEEIKSVRGVFYLETMTDPPYFVN